MINFGEVKVSISRKLLADLKNLGQTVVTESFAQKLGNIIVPEAKKAIRSGMSPVRGVGRFVAYKDPEKYPGGRKSARPVNLTLTGEMIDSLNFRKVGSKVVFGIFEDEVSQELMDRVDTHNRGTHPHVPKRQFIPKKGQEFIVSIQAKIKKLYRDRILEVINRIVK